MPAATEAIDAASMERASAPTLPPDYYPIPRPVEVDATPDLMDAILTRFVETHGQLLNRARATSPARHRPDTPARMTSPVRDGSWRAPLIRRENGRQQRRRSRSRSPRYSGRRTAARNECWVPACPSTPPNAIK